MAEKKLPGSELIEAALLAAPQVQTQVTERYRMGLVHGALAGVAAGTLAYAMIRKNIT